MHFIGVDLGWKMNPPLKNRTAVCVLNSNGEVEEMLLVTDDMEILDVVGGYEDVWVGIDAPLIVPNVRGTRDCERSLFEKGIIALPSSKSYMMRKYGGCRGEAISLELLVRGFSFLDCGLSYGRLVIEVYPYGFLSVVTSGNVPRYKKGSEDVRRKGALKVLRLIRDYEPSIKVPEMLDREVVSSRTRDLTLVMDKIDALISVLCVYTHWLYAGKRTEVIGDMDGGFILMPRTEVIW